MEAVASLAAHCCSQPTCLQVPYIKESLQDYLRVPCYATPMYVMFVAMLFCLAIARVYAK